MSSIFGGGSGSAAVEGAAFRVHKGGTDQTGVTSATVTLVTWSTVSFDTHGYFGSNRFTPLTAGKYLLGTSLEFGAGADQLTGMIALIYKNGTVFQRLCKIQASGAGGVGGSGSVIVEANGTTDYFEVYAQQNSGSNQTIDGQAHISNFWGFYIRS